MIKSTTTRLSMLLSLLLLVALWAPVRAPAADDIDEMLANAKTAADHEGIAAYYDKEAAAAKEKADLHRRMLAIVKKQGGPGIAKWHMDRHCERLIKQYDDSAQMYTEMAHAHREMARDLK